uniref:Uncharacterized protein n=1 Tax=Salmo trutta TaxID=8032 RepID=A0A673ZN00_SALTR
IATYFDEHDCEPTNPEEQYRQNALLELNAQDMGRKTYLYAVMGYATVPQI